MHKEMQGGQVCRDKRCTRRCREGKDAESKEMHKEVQEMHKEVQEGKDAESKEMHKEVQEGQGALAE